MKKDSKYFFMMFFGLILLAFVFQSGVIAAGQKRPFKWMDDEDYNPFIYKTVDGKPAGFYKDLMVEVFRRMDVPLQCEVYPWKRAQKYVEEGIGDGMVTTLTKTRTKLFIATEPLFINSERVFTRKDNPRIREIMAVDSIEGLKPFKIVETIGSGWAEEHFKDLNIEWAPTYTSALNMLANGRVDAYILGYYPGMADIVERINNKVHYSEKLKKIVVSRNSLVEIPFCLLIRKNSEYVSIIPRFNNILKLLKKNGTYQVMFKKYFSEAMKIPEGVQERSF
ncbi:hypothetical protein DGMP_38650 [Desulfomarina profundi]|uniref:Solute-binding protein family 3/N-terminal domain-containing protein n=1 Tax=Desulfomarina profundi TaxID=2772557 RepID=A0A8D5JNY8_9BACT|nr:transporter substrate-binding domain-containing protein [Desulfomarina profundi]BCL63172.1 hypothetical protein DGMP_38650 [Desulfomarina profundi]